MHNAHQHLCRQILTVFTTALTTVFTTTGHIYSYAGVETRQRFSVGQRAILRSKSSKLRRIYTEYSLMKERRLTEATTEANEERVAL